MYWLQLNDIQVLLYALALAFVFVEVFPGRIRLTSRKPFNCIKCMTGWFAAGLAVASHHGWEDCVLLGICGIFIGAMFEGIKMRYL